MKRKSHTPKIFFSVFAFLLFGFSANSQTVFNYTGAMETYIVPTGVTAITIEAYGAEGGSSPASVGFGNGGLGGYVTGEFSVTPGETLYIYVGGQGAESETGGFNGGGNGSLNPGGGGASDVRQGGTALADRIIIAGGGGGGAWETAWSSGWGDGTGTGDGGDGGDLVGQDGESWQSACQAGTGGTQTAGGVGGGDLGVGGDGASSPGDTGGGGGGYYGGGGGGDCTGYNGAGGGGSSYTDPSATSVSHTQGVQTGDGQVIITPLCTSLITTVSADTICQKGELILYAESTTGGTITWNLGVEDSIPQYPDTTGLVTYTATSSESTDCGFSTDVFIKSGPEFTLAASDEVVGGDGSIAMTLIDGVFPFTYDWDNDGTGDFDDEQNLSGLTAGTYTVEVMHGNGCTITDSATVNSQLGIDQDELSFRIYPNPTKNDLNIEIEGSFDYVVTNLMGQEIKRGLAVDQVALDLSFADAGVYFVQLKKAHFQKTIRFVKE